MKPSFSLRMLALMLTIAMLIPSIATFASAETGEEEYVIQLIVSSSQTHSLCDENPHRPSYQGQVQHRI